MKELHGNRIEAKVKESMDEKQGLPAWLVIYVKAAAEVAAQLSAEEREEVEYTRTAWGGEEEVSVIFF